MTSFRPKYITFDCYGTLTRFQMGEVARSIYADRVPNKQMDQFIADFSTYRMDEVFGAWKPYDQVLKNAIERTCKKYKIQYVEAEGQRFYDAVPTWGPHPDVTEPLKKVAEHYPLVILSNAMNEQIHDNVKLLGAPFHAVYTAQDANAYKPRFQAFEYLFDQLGCDPADLLHVSSSFRYDLMSAYDLGIKNKVWVNRGHDPAIPYYGYTEIKDISGLPAMLGL